MFAILVLIWSSVIAYIFYYKNREQKKFFESLKDYNGPKPKPIVGNLLDFGTNNVEILQNLLRIHHQYGPITKFFKGSKQVELMTSDPELVEILLTSNKEITKSSFYEKFRPWFLNSVFLLTGQYWQQRRKLINSAFHFKLLENFIPIFNTESSILIEKLSSALDKTSTDIWPFLSAFALDSICKTSMGTSVNAQQSFENDYIKSVKTICKIITENKFSFWKRNDFLFKFSAAHKEQANAIKVLHGFTKSVIEQKRKQNSLDKNKENLEESDLGRKKKFVLLDLLLEIAGDTLSNTDILEEIEGFMFAGHDTTAATACYALYEIARNPRIQDTIVKELEGIFGCNKKIQPTMQDLNNMKYLDLVIKEALRKYPTVPYFSRMLENDLMFKDKIIPKGVTLSIFVYYMHNDPTIYKDPEVFDPDRFLLENLNKRHAFAYVPFSAGPRNCMGQKYSILQLKAVISTILRNFHLLPADPQCDLILSLEILLKSENGVCIQLKKREM